MQRALLKIIWLSPVPVFAAEAQDRVEEAVDDYLEELRDLLGVPYDYAAAAEDTPDDAPDPESGGELQRLLAHLHDPVTPGADYSVLQVRIVVVVFDLG